MAGYILYNGFWNPNGPPATVQALANAAEQRGVVFTPLPNTAACAAFNGGVVAEPFSEGDVALFWDKDVRLARAMEAVGVTLYNTADAVAVCDDKAATHLALASVIPMPETMVAPLAYTEVTDQIMPFLSAASSRLGFPLVVKECFGSLGGQVSLAHTREELNALAVGMGAKPFLLQRFLGAYAGTDLRLYVVGGQVVAAMKRVATDGDFRSNIGSGGHGEAYVPTKEEIGLALRCCERLRLTIAGVDLLWDDGGVPLVCEVNSCAQVNAITAITGVDVAGEIVDFVLRTCR